MLKQKLTFTYTGEDQVFIQTWGAAGGDGEFQAGFCCPISA